MCISGDVPASLLTLGTPQEVSAYCRRLIDVVGEGGGFMLTTGCECPIDAKRENIRAMVETGKSYAGRKGSRKVSPKAATVKTAAEVRHAPLSGEIARAVADLRFREVLEMVKRAADAGKDPMGILSDCRAGMDRVGELYSAGEYFLSELMMSANIFKKVVSVLEPLLAKGGRESDIGRVVIATPKGDIHDIGKDIVATLLRAAGFSVNDLGVDVPAEKVVQAVGETDARIVAMSALITPTFQSMKRVVDLMKERGLREGRYVILGGGPTTAAVRDYVGADAWSLDPKEGVNRCREFIAGLRK